MTLPVTIPNTFANATSSIPLSQLDTNFSTLANVINDINSGAQTLANLKASNVSITGGVIANVTLDNVTVDVETLSNVTINGGNVTVTNMVATTANATTANITTIVAGAGTSAAPSITTTGDLNTGVFFPAADTIAAATGGAERLRIDSSGNVGIGTSSPTSLLTVVGESNISSVLFKQNITAYTSGDSLPVIARTSGFAGYPNGSLLLQSRSSAAADIAFITGSTPSERMRIDSSGNVGIGTSSPASLLHVKVATDQNVRTYTGGADDARIGCLNDAGDTFKQFSIAGSPLLFRTLGGTEHMRITSAGSVLMGGTTAVVDGQGYTTIERSGDAPQLSFYRNDTSVSSGNGLGQIAFYGNDTTSNTPTRLAYIIASASGTHAAGDNPTDIVFGTTPDGTETVAEAGRITQSGAYVLKGGTTTAAAGVGIIFPATQVASANVNCLDDYEEGTFTPTVIGSTSAGTGTYTTQVGFYTKIGDLVTVQVFLEWTAHTGTGNMRFGNLPFGIPNTTGLNSGVAFGYVNNIALTANNVLTGYTAINSTYIVAAQYPVGGGAASTVPIDTAGAVVYTISYKTTT